MPPVLDRPPVLYTALNTVGIAFIARPTAGPSTLSAMASVVLQPNDPTLLASYFSGATSSELNSSFDEDAFADDSVGLLLKPLSFDF